MARLRLLSAVLFALSGIGLMVALTIGMGPSELSREFRFTPESIGIVSAAVLLLSGAMLYYLQVKDPHPCGGWDPFPTWEDEQRAEEQRRLEDQIGYSNRPRHS